ncbi:MAG: hypothetical protein JJT78_09655 [Leptospira sp.]|nr:hypothetical protein [Leptospira sp.]
MKVSLKLVLLFSLLPVVGCLSTTRLVEPGRDIPEDACLVIFGMIEPTGPVSIGARKDFDYRTYESGYLLLQEIVPESKPFINSKKSKKLKSKELLEDQVQFKIGGIYKPQFNFIREDSEWIRDVKDKIVDPKRIYYAFTGLKPGSHYALKQIGYTRTESYQVGKQTYTRSIPVYIKGDALQNYKQFPIVCEPKKVEFLGLAGLRVSGTSFSVFGDALPLVGEKAEDSDLEYFFGPYETTKKGAAWYVRDRLFETQKSGFWHEQLKPNQSKPKESENSQKSIGK